MKRAIIVSGYFNPLHKGHIEYFKLAKREGDALFVIVNNDFQRSLKGSKEFMLEDERILIVNELEIVDKTILSVDKDSSLFGVNPILPKDNLKIINPVNEKNLEVTEDGQPLIRDDAIGEIRMKDLEKEAIIRTLRFFNNNRRKTARSLGVSERTLYRKIEDYNLEPKIKRN